MFINVSGTWKSINSFFVNVSGTWKQIVSGFINVAGVWKQFFSSALSIAQQVTISQSTDATTFLTTLTGTNYHWSPGPPVLTYKFQRSTDNEVTWSDLNSGSITDPGYGLSNTKTYALPASGPNIGVLPNVLNYYRFRVDATYGTLSENSVSSSTTIQGPTNTTISLANPAFASIELSWTASTGANRYLVYKSTDNSIFSEYTSVPSGTTSIYGISDLTGGNTYYFYVVPVTGGSFTYPGYYGNNSNTLTLPILATPTLSAATSSGSGFSFNIENYNASNTYGLSTTLGSVSRTGSTVTVTGLSAGQSATVTVSATRSGYGNSNSASRTGSALAEYNITWNPNGGTFSNGSSNNEIDTGIVGTVTSPSSTPTRSGYEFLYWRNTPSGIYDYQVNAGGTWTIGTSSSTNVTFYARWQLVTPTASNFARSDSTTTPSQPGTLSFSSSNNQVTTSWSNGSPITSVNFAASGAGVNTNYTDSSAPFMTSDVSAYSSSGTYSATVTNYNNSFQVTASWNQTNAQSYQVHYYSSVFGSDSTAITNNSGSSVSHTIPWGSNAGSFTFTGLTVYYGANGTGSSTFYSTGLSAITPTQKSSSRSGSTFLTYVSPNLTAPTIYSVSQSTPGGSLSVYFTGGSGPYYQIWWQSSNNYSSVTGYDASGSSSPVTDTSGPSAGTWYVAVRSVSSTTNTGSGPSSTISAWSSPVQFTVSQPTYTVTWNANGGSVSPTSSTVNQGSSVTAPTPTRSGYTFLYWRDTPSGDYTYSVNAGASFTPPYSITMYARWQVVSSGTAPSTPTGLTNTYSSGPSWTGSWSASTGTATITYYYTLYQSTSNGGSITATYSGSTTSTSFTRAMSSSNGLWAYFTVYASNAYGTSGTATSSWA